MKCCEGKTEAPYLYPCSLCGKKTSMEKPVTGWRKWLLSHPILEGFVWGGLLYLVYAWAYIQKYGLMWLGILMIFSLGFLAGRY